MTLHYHGTPITPASVFLSLAGRCFCVSYAQPQDIRRAHDFGQSVLLDNGAFSVWQQGATPDWPGYYGWCDPWLNYPTTWAIIPDSVTGGAEENDRLIAEWPFGERGAPVWHLHEPIQRLLELCDRWPRICFGSSAQYAVIGTESWERRMDEAFNVIETSFRRLPWLHMLRGMSIAGMRWPFASLDSTDVARNHNRPQNSARKLADRWDAIQCGGVWHPRPSQLPLLEGSA